MLRESVTKHFWVLITWSLKMGPERARLCHSGVAFYILKGT